MTTSSNTALPKAKPGSGKGSADLDALTIARFPAAIGVVWFHFGRAQLSFIPKWLHGFIISGYTGVTFFFVLSGFILTYVYHRRDLHNSIELRRFAVHRIARIYPVYLLAWALYGLLSPPHSWSGIIAWGVLSATLLQSWIPNGPPNWNWPGWSLSAEAFFYACFPALQGASRRLRTGVLYAVLGLLLIANTGYIELTHEIGNRIVLRGTHLETTARLYLSYLPLLQMLLFAMGVVLGRLFLALRSRPIVSPWIAAALMVGILATLSVRVDAYPGERRDMLLAPEFCALVLALACTRVRAGWLTSCGLALGKASYALYILQFPVWIFLARFINVAAPPVVQITGFCVVLTAISLCVYRFVERPAENFIRSRFVAAPVVVTTAS
jgi:peptidoglycan/LPS O-acetylase OafA/YrhL